MKWILTACVVCFAGTAWSQLPAVTPEVSQYAPFRVYGTNLYDFSEVIKSVLKGQADPTYCVRGLVTEINAAGLAGSVIIRRAAGSPGYMFRQATNQPANSQPVLTAQAAVSLGRRPDGMISSSQFAALPPEVQANFEWMQPTEDVLIANLHEESLRPGKKVQLFALPLGWNQGAGGGKGAEGLPRFDYGERFTGGITNFTALLRVTPSGMKSVRLEGIGTKGSVAATDAAQRLLRWQQEEATNGAAHAQYSLAKRYLRGEGVAADESLGEYWLKKAAEQNFPDAVRVLDSRNAAK